LLQEKKSEDSASATAIYGRMSDTALTALRVMAVCLRDDGCELHERFDRQQLIPFAQCHALATALLLLASAQQASEIRLPRWLELRKRTENLAASLNGWLAAARGLDAKIVASLDGPLKGAVRSPIGVSLGEAADLLQTVLPTISQVQMDVETFLILQSPDMANLVQEGRKSHAYLIGALFDTLGELRTPAISWRTLAFHQKERVDFLDDGGTLSLEAKLPRLRRAAKQWRALEKRLRQSP
jgi:hypothetical protein